jgi:hypothetical protein
MFERTKSGQQNRASLISVNYICYIEGGNGTDNDNQAPDITFWSKTLKTLRPDIRIKFVPRGGKPILERLAKDIIEKDISNVLVAMDGDYDVVTGDTIVDRRVLYTYGHSWENDVFCLDNVILSYEALCHCEPAPQAVVNHLTTCVGRFNKEVYWAVQADFVALINGCSVLPRDKPGRVVKQLPNHGGPKIEKSEVLKLIAEAKRKKKTKNNVPRIDDIARHCVGHIYDLAMIYIIRSAAKQFGRRASISPDHARDVCLQTFPNLLRDQSIGLSRFHSVQSAAL